MASFGASKPSECGLKPGGFTRLSPEITRWVRTAAEMCPQFWEEWEGHCYLFSPKDTSYHWMGARTACRANNSLSDLPSVTSDREEMFIRNNTLGSTFWLGGFRLVPSFQIFHQSFNGV